jgi:iron complex outermembrane receptor protein
MSPAGSGSAAGFAGPSIARSTSCPSVPLFPLTADYSELPFDVPSQPGASMPIIVNDMPTGAIVTRSELTARDRLTDRAATWRIGGEIDVGPRTLAYASVGTGYRPGGFNTASGFETYDPERIRAYTLGLRHRDRNGKLQLDLEGFWWNYRDQQVSSLRPDLSTPPQNANITDNIGNSRIRGLEADVRFRLQPSTQLRAIVQFLDAEYRSFSYVQVSAPVPPLTGCAAAVSAAPIYTVDCVEKQPYNSPRWALSLEARQSFVLENLTVTALAGTHFRSARNIGFAFLPEQRIDASWTSHAQLILTHSNDPWELAAFVRNIEDDRIPQFMIYHPVSNALVAATSTPRVMGLRLSTRFGMQNR